MYSVAAGSCEIVANSTATSGPPCFVQLCAPDYEGTGIDGTGINGTGINGTGINEIGLVLAEVTEQIWAKCGSQNGVYRLGIGNASVELFSCAAE